MKPVTAAYVVFSHMEKKGRFGERIAILSMYMALAECWLNASHWRESQKSSSFRLAKVTKQ